MTKKGDDIQEKILRILDRNPDGLRIGQLQKLLEVSRNSVYRYLDLLEMKGSICKQPDKTYKLKERIRPQTIYGFQYQAILQGLRIVGGEKWDIKTKEGRDTFKKLGKITYPMMKFPDLSKDENFKKQTHHLSDIIESTLKVLQETLPVETFKVDKRLDENGFPDKLTNLAAIISFEGGYVLSEAVVENGFAHYYIIAGLFEVWFEKLIPPIYGGKTIVDVIKIDKERQIIDLALYVIFDEKNPYKGP
ncbi:MAG: helix-turn-helix domain-containing protein [Promethearchaeota archaeon]